MKIVRIFLAPMLGLYRYILYNTCYFNEIMRVCFLITIRLGIKNECSSQLGRTLF